MQAAILSDRVLGIQRSPSAAARDLVASLKAKGRDIISLTIGEPDSATPHHVVEAAAAAAWNGRTRYTAAPGIDELRDAVVRKLRDENKLQADRSGVTVGVGAKQLIFNALAATINPGDEVLIPAPYWVSYPDIVKLHGGKAVVLEGDSSNHFKITGDEVRKAITPKTKWLLLNTPNNPSGAVYSREELSQIANVLRANDQVWLMSDEIYEHFVFGGREHVSIASVDEEVAQRTLTVNGVSKAYAMTGWRIGYASGPEVLVGAINKIISQSTTCPSSVSQVAAAAALDGPQDSVRSLAKRFEARRDRVVEQLNAIPGVECPLSQGAFYVFPKIEGLLGRKSPDGRTIHSDLDLAEYLASEAGVATIAGTSYGVHGYLRCSLAVSEKKLDEACKRIASACNKLS